MEKKSQQQSITETQLKRPTLKTIADITGLGVTTVSRALKDTHDISPRTKALVREVADQVDYTPKPGRCRCDTQFG
jgi:LacI family transcriptional regulator